MTDLHITNLFPPDYPEEKKLGCLEYFKNEIFIQLCHRYQNCPNVSIGLILKLSESYEINVSLWDQLYIPDNAEGKIPLDFLTTFKWENEKVCVLNPYKVKFFYTEYDAQKYFDENISKNKPATNESSGSSDEIDDFTNSDEDAGFCQ